MSTIKDEWTVAMEDVARALHGTIAVLGRVQKSIEDTLLDADVLADAPQQHEQALNQLEAMIRSHGELPDDYDPEQDLARDALASLRESFATSGTVEILREAEEAEEALVAATAEALSLEELGPESEELLAGLGRLAVETGSDLARLRLAAILTWA
ncbi:hypothetical protein SAMN06265365_111132 [Tistlia consotensis]|uniref:DUF2383 domain-containing protein n=1 Tax=Tistlia consotensis USBA 355 TaxID=560819 RepID=A0A1Y6C2M3_9PROT|nr:hypothetical protein [Tistlia consotensis]SMF33612.1 hypothetical protein SAMN05428998_111134 [Tistlia consotensis USBA 355]SNR69932.1 hypothetical protein SAMN06265365_111132 [Tistlia consotensis]